MRHQLCWAGHCMRMEDTCLPINKHCTPSCAIARDLRADRECALKTPLKSTSRETQQTGENLAVDKSKWRLIVHFETNRLKQGAERRIRKKERAQHPGQITPSGTNICHICGRVCRACIGLISHPRTYSVPPN